MEYKVRDGFVKLGEKVWWLAETGPKFVRVVDDESNIKDYPECYQITKPVFVNHPEVDWLVIYEHEDGFNHYKEGRKVNKTKHQRKKPGFTFEDGVYLGQDCGFHASYLVITMERPDVFTTQQRIGAVQEYLKARAWQSDYSFKPLRKKLKLYIKWLQSEMSK